VNNINWKTILSVIGLLLIGYVAGFHHHRHITQSRIAEIAAHRIAPNAPMAERFFTKINATEEERELLRPIFRKHMRELHQIGQTIRKKRKPVLDSMRAEIEGHLNADQKAEFEKVMKRINRSFPKRKGKKKPSRERTN